MKFFQAFIAILYYLATKRKNALLIIAAVGFAIGFYLARIGVL